MTENNNVVDYMTSKLNRINIDLVKSQYDLEVLEKTMEYAFVSSKTIIGKLNVIKSKVFLFDHFFKI